MRRAIVALAIAVGLALLPGCARGLEMRVARLEWENAQLREKLDAVSADVRALTRRMSSLPPGQWRGEAPRPEPEFAPRRPGGPPGGHPKGRRP